MKKLIMVATMLALVLAVTVPAIAASKHHRGNNRDPSVSQAISQESETGNITLNFTAPRVATTPTSM